MTQEELYQKLYEEICYKHGYESFDAPVLVLRKWLHTLNALDHDEDSEVVEKYKKKILDLWDLTVKVWYLSNEYEDYEKIEMLQSILDTENE